MKKEKSVRLLDVASLAGVGAGTVSRVLNNEPSVSEDKRNRVFKAVEALGYQRNAIARSLKINKTKTLGVIIPDISNEYYSEIVRGAEDVARGQNYSIILCNTDGQIDQEKRTITLLSEKQVDGLIMLTHALSTQTLDCLRKTSVPTVLVSTLVEDESIVTINISNEQGAQEAVDYLIGMGHRLIAMLAGPEWDVGGGENRLKGYRKALEKHNIPFDEQLVERCSEYSYLGGYACTERLLKKQVLFTAVFAASDHIAIGCNMALFENGLRIPQDISVMGFDNLSITAFMTPALTTVNQPRYKMGQMAVQKLCKLIAGEKLESSRILVEHDIIQRASTAAPGKLFFLNPNDENSKK